MNMAKAQKGWEVDPGAIKCSVKPKNKSMAKEAVKTVDSGLDREMLLDVRYDAQIVADAKSATPNTPPSNNCCKKVL